MNEHITELFLTLKAALVLSFVWAIDGIYGTLMAMLGVTFVSQDILDFLTQTKPVITYGTTVLIFVVYIVKLIKLSKNKEK